MQWGLSIVSAWAAAAAAAAAPLPHAPLLEQARSFSKHGGEIVWPGYGSAPFGFLLIEGERETLLCHPVAPQGFEAEGTDAATGCTRWGRARSGLPAGLLAAMPVLGPPATIVMGTPEGTGRTQPAWLRTILHEHFHQWQMALPDYFERVDALGLKGGDQTGMWMLSFPFPYDDARAGADYAAASAALADALALRGKAGFLPSFDRYIAARRRFAAAVSERDWRYFELQLWQEGTARWTEIQLGKAYPDRAVQMESLALERRTLEQLGKPELRTQKREAAYPLGAGEAMLMSACGPAWRQTYPSVLSHGALLSIARKACGAIRR